MMMTEGPDVDSYWKALAAVLPRFAPDEQRAALTLYDELAKGSAVSVEQLATALEAPVHEARALLERDSIRSLIYPDEEGRVLGFGGLAAAPMSHRFEVQGRTLWTWCAWDSLFIPEILAVEARVESEDPESGAPVRLTVGPDGVRSRGPEGTVVSFIMPDAEQFETSATNVMASFCHFVFFFESRESGERWTTRRDGTFIFTLDEAMELARRLNARTFGDALESVPRYRA